METQRRGTPELFSSGLGKSLPEHAVTNSWQSWKNTFVSFLTVSKLSQLVNGNELHVLVYQPPDITTFLIVLKSSSYKTQFCKLDPPSMGICVTNSSPHRHLEPVSAMSVLAIHLLCHQNVQLTPVQSLRSSGRGSMPQTVDRRVSGIWQRQGRTGSEALPYRQL